MAQNNKLLSSIKEHFDSFILRPTCVGSPSLKEELDSTLSAEIQAVRVDGIRIRHGTIFQARVASVQSLSGCQAVHDALFDKLVPNILWAKNSVGTSLIP